MSQASWAGGRYGLPSWKEKVTNKLLCLFQRLAQFKSPAFSTHSLFHSQTSWMNFSLPRSWRLIPLSLISFFSTTTWVAIPAWSQPGFHKVVSPRILCLHEQRVAQQFKMWLPDHNKETIMDSQKSHGATKVKYDLEFQVCEHSDCSYHRVRVSWIALVRAWPRWSDPVTLGGGIHIMKMPRGFWSLILFLCKRKWVRQTWCFRLRGSIKVWHFLLWQYRLPYPVLWFEESLLFPPWIPGSLHILRTVGVRQWAIDIWYHKKK